MTGERRSLTVATDGDVPAIVALMNLAYRAQGDAAGWTTEADYIGGTRTTEELVRQDMAASDGASLLLMKEPDGTLTGCVRVEPKAEGLWYLGSLTVRPDVQNGGLGRHLLAAAEQWATSRGAREMRMTVVHLRSALIAWYERRGYRIQPGTVAFPYGDDRFGTPLRDDLHFLILQKSLHLKY